jgi:general secretion pathway protein D
VTISPPLAPGQRGRFVVLNFDNAEVETVVHAASEILNFNYILAPDVRGKVTIQTSGRIAYEDVFGVLLAVLEVHGFTAVKSGNLYKIVRIPDAATRPVPTIVGTTLDPGRDGDEVITQIVPIRFSNVNDLRTLLQPLISQQRGGNVIAHRETNVLIVTDTTANIRRLLDIIKLVDVEVALEEVQIIQLQYADAGEAAQILTQLFASGRIRAAAATGAPAPPPAPAAPPQPGAPAAPQPQAQVRGGTEAPAEHPPMILPERRTNSLVVHARRNELETIRTLISRLDVNISGGRRVFIYYAENAKAKDLAATMNAIYNREGAAQPTNGASAPAAQAIPLPITPVAAAPVGPGAAQTSFVEGQFRFIADETTNAIILATYPRLWTEIEDTLRQLDRSPRQVLIEVLAAEVTLNDDTKLGIEWAIRSGNFAATSVPPLTPAGPRGPQIGVPIIPIPPPSGTGALSGLTAFLTISDKFFAALNAFAAENRANILSSPSILTSENKKAIINVSQSVPIITSQQVPFGGGTTLEPGPGQQPTTASVFGTQTVEYLDAGIVLTVTPRIGERGTVALDVKQEVNDVGPAQPPTGSPIIIKREAETSVVLLNNQTLVLGGLIKDDRNWVESGIPILHKLPVIGPLFGTKQETVEKTELLILITPRVIGTALDAAKITETMRKFNPEFDRSFDKGILLPPTSPGLAPEGSRPSLAPAPAPPATPPATPPVSPPAGSTPSPESGAQPSSMRQGSPALSPASAPAPVPGPPAASVPPAGPNGTGDVRIQAPPATESPDGRQIDSSPAVH